MRDTFPILRPKDVGSYAVKGWLTFARCAEQSRRRSSDVYPGITPEWKHRGPVAERKAGSARGSDRRCVKARRSACPNSKVITAAVTSAPLVGRRDHVSKVNWSMSR